MLGRSVQFQALEPRRLMSAAYPTVYEQYMVELYNWARADPNAAAARYGVALNEGPTAYPLTADPKQPLAINPYLTDAARSYAQLLIDIDQFTHYANGTDPGGRMAAAGYSFTGSYGSGENAGLNSVFGFAGETGFVDTHFQNFYTDGSISGRWHRLTMMNGAYKEVGSGHASGNWQGFNAFISVQDFAFSGEYSYLTGVAYTDTSDNDFYTPGEQMAGVTVLAVRNSDGAEFSTTTWSSGGYSLALAPGTYTVWASGGTLGGWVRSDNVTIGTQNVKRDFRPDYVNSQTGPETDPPAPETGFAQINGSALTISGTGESDTFSLSVSGGILHVTRNDETLSFTAANVTSIALSAGDGNDTIALGDGVISSNISGGDGDDSIQGGSGADILNGNAGDDTIRGGAGSDRIYGGLGNDILDGQTYPDRMYGGDGNDLMYGGSHNDVMYGENGNDTIAGQNQNDYIDGGAGADYMSGGRDIDTVNYSSRSAGLLIQLSNTYSQMTGVSGESGEGDNALNDLENINGGEGSDRIIGSTAANIIRGYGGNDTIYGMAGADALYGGDGNDRIYDVDALTDYIDGGAGRDIFYGDLIDTVLAIEVR